MILPYTRKELEQWARDAIAKVHKETAVIAGCNQKAGYVLTDEYEAYHIDWLDNYSACTCHLGHPPCSSCVHPGHPLCLEETPEAWRIDILTWIPVEGIL